MDKKKDLAINALKPFIGYFKNVNNTRKLGIVLFMLLSGRKPTNTMSLLSLPGTFYGMLISPDTRFLVILLKVFISIAFFLSIASAISEIPYGEYALFLLSVSLIGFSFFVLRSFNIAQTGFLVQFRIPENYYLVERIMDNNWKSMSLSTDSSVRYASIAFQQLKNEQLNPFKILSVIEGIVTYFEITKDDVENIGFDEDDLEKILLQDQGEKQ